MRKNSAKFRNFWGGAAYRSMENCAKIRISKTDGGAEMEETAREIMINAIAETLENATLAQLDALLHLVRGFLKM